MRPQAEAEALDKYLLLAPTPPILAALGVVVWVVLAVFQLPHLPLARLVILHRNLLRRVLLAQLAMGKVVVLAAVVVLLARLLLVILAVLAARDWLLQSLDHQ
jgi:hypothetical protein